MGVCYHVSMNKNKLNNHNKAFTIIELLIVIVIIGILVAITAVAYNGVTKSANATSTKTDIANIKKATDIYAIKNNENLPEKEQDLTDAGLYNVITKAHFYNGKGYQLDREESPPIIKKGQYYITSYQEEGNWPGSLNVYYWDYENNNWTSYSIRKENKWAGSYSEKIKYDSYGDDNIRDPKTGEGPCKAESLNECTYSRLL